MCKIENAADVAKLHHPPGIKTTLGCIILHLWSSFKFFYRLLHQRFKDSNIFFLNRTYKNIQQINSAGPATRISKFMKGKSQPFPDPSETLKMLKYNFLLQLWSSKGCTKSFILNSDLSKGQVKLPRAYFGSPTWFGCPGKFWITYFLKCFKLP